MKYINSYIPDIFFLIETKIDEKTFNDLNINDNINEKY